MSVHLVSKTAGVSVATVSRVINHSPNVAPETVALVRRAMAKLGYVPPAPERRSRRTPVNAQARGVHKNNVALLFPDTSNRALKTSLSARLLHGVGEVLRAKAINMIVTTLQPDAAAPPCIRDGQIDGVIVRASEFAEPLLPQLTDAPCVWLLEGHQHRQGDRIVDDNAEVARLAVRHLKTLGCERVAVINPQGLHASYRSRCDWFGIEAPRAGLSVQAYVRHDEPEVSLESTQVWEPKLADLVDRFAASTPRATGLFVPCPDDMITFVYRRLQARGVKVGTDVKLVVCSYDPPRLASLDPTIAHVDIQPEAMGRAAVELLLWRLRHANEPPRRVMVAPVLVPGAAPAALL
jgi:LacI family transcriptional regulator